MKKLLSNLGKMLFGVGAFSLLGGGALLKQKEDAQMLQTKIQGNGKINVDSNYSIRIHFPAINKEIEMEKEKLRMLIEKKEQKEEEISNLTKIHHQKLESFKDELFKAGAGEIGDYKKCASQFLITGQFLSPADSNSYVGDPNKLKKVEEYEIEVTSKGSKLEAVIKTLIKNHPYQEPSYKITEDLKNIVISAARGIRKK